jgi:hypothetical protein
LPAFASKFQKFCIEKLITDFIKSMKLADEIVALRRIYGFVSAKEKYLENNISLASKPHQQEHQHKEKLSPLYQTNPHCG